MKANEIYFETLGLAIRAFVAQIEQTGGDFLADLPAVTVAEAFNGGVSYGQTVARSFELTTFKGKPTKKWAHVTLYRMESGRYELTCYIL